MLYIFHTHYFRDAEGSHHKKGGKKKEKPKSKHKKATEKAPKLIIIDLDREAEVVECQLEASKHSTITFKFNKDDDQPGEIAETLVSKR